MWYIELQKKEEVLQKKKEELQKKEKALQVEEDDLKWDQYSYDMQYGSESPWRQE